MTEEKNSLSDLSPSTGGEGGGRPLTGGQAAIPLHIESLIFASDRPLTSPEITELINAAFGFMEDKIMPEQTDASLEGIVEKYSSDFYPFEVRQSGGGWQFLTKKEYHKTVAQLNGEKFLKRLSGATLETLAIIAYKQPITKGEIESIRGVNSDYSVQKLLEKELVVISGRNEAMPGHPLIYNTSKTFMDYFGINSPEDLPKIKEVLANIAVEPTVVNGAVETEEPALAVSDNGELVINDDNEEENYVKEDRVESEKFTTEEDVISVEEMSLAEETENQPEIKQQQEDNKEETIPDDGDNREATEDEADSLKAVDETGTDVDDELPALDSTDSTDTNADENKNQPESDKKAEDIEE